MTPNPRKLTGGELTVLKKCCGGAIPPRTMSLAEATAGRMSQVTGSTLELGTLALIAELGERKPAGRPPKPIEPTVAIPAH